ncbi:MAG TPA: branched-chain amino acid ABC transporter permease [Bryobacteraceae bacterium]|jgi:branched-chain amino acid transport system permease protein
MLQLVADGIIVGSIVALAAIGLSLTLSIFRFSNFSHGELLAWGAYLALVVNGMIGTSSAAIGPFSFGWGPVFATLCAVAGTAALAVGLDALLFRRLRRQGSITLVIASFGASLVLRSLLQYWQGGVPKYYSESLQIAINIVPRSFHGGLRLTADQMLVIALTLVVAACLHGFLRYTLLGRSMRAAAANPDLARVVGINPERVFLATWIIGGSLAAIAGVFAGITVQLRPTMGTELLLPLFSAVILGGTGSRISTLWGAVLGGFVLGLSESAAVSLLGAEYRPVAAFVVLTVILLVKPNGLFGDKSA